MANSKSKNIWIEREMILSPAFRKLNGRAMEVLLLFFYRRQWSRPSRKGKWCTTNNGEIVFPYKEAKKRFKIPKSSFARAIDSLIERWSKYLCGKEYAQWFIRENITSMPYDLNELDIQYQDMLTNPIGFFLFKSPKGKYSVINF